MIIGMQLTSRNEYYDVVDKTQQLDFELQGKIFVSKCGYKFFGKDYEIEAMLFQNKVDNEDYYIKISWFSNGKILDETELAFYSEKEIKNSQDFEIVVINIINDRNKHKK